MEKFVKNLVDSKVHDSQFTKGLITKVFYSITVNINTLASSNIEPASNYIGNTPVIISL